MYLIGKVFDREFISISDQLTNSFIHNLTLLKRSEQGVWKMSDSSFSVAKFLSSKKSMLQNLIDKFISKGEGENSVGYVY
jgi:hypothetical protein